MEILFTGFGFTDAATTLLRVAMGLFFSISGYHKLFNPKRHATVAKTMVDDHVPEPKFNSWFVPTVEFSGGIALIVGFLVPLAALGLMVICCVATIVDGLKRIPSWSPLDLADYLDDVLYLPEVLYSIILISLIWNGGGPYSVDYLMVHSPEAVIAFVLIFLSASAGIMLFLVISRFAK